MSICNNRTENYDDNNTSSDNKLIAYSIKNVSKIIIRFIFPTVPPIQGSINDLFAPIMILFLFNLK